MTHTPPASSAFTDYSAVKDYLYALKAGGVKFGIDRMRRLVAELNHPERSYPVIHVAGTNGKGSVAAMLESILRAGGLRTGLYTSPHLVKLGERVQVDRQLLTEAEIMAYARELQPVAARAAKFAPDEHATFFEFMTAMAFLQFQRRHVDVAIIEVGMGGRLDATNVVQPAVSVITSIGLDHCAELGDTVEKIAAEKAGILKPGVPVVIGRLPPGAEQVVRGVAAANGAAVHAVREVFGEDLAGYPVTNLEGDYQRWNAATATLAARLLPVRLRPEAAAIERGLGHVAWPGRWQRLTVGGRHLILDASHNPEGAQVLEENLRRLEGALAGAKPIIVTGALGEFRARALLEVVARHAREIHVVTPQQARATPYAEMVNLAPTGAGPLLREGTVSAIFPDARTCTLGKPGDTIVITGSLYLLGEILERIEPDRGAGEGKLQDF
jgi:dihydrofolate synthase/folylpolyglutamate synthase